MFDYLKYALKAKGRHGTHSPFVYLFVEEVLRKPKSPIQSFKHLDKSNKILIRLISFLKVETLYTLSNSNIQQKEMIQMLFPKLDLKVVEAINEIKLFDNALLLLDLNDLDYTSCTALKNIKNQANFSVFISAIHNQAKQQETWEQLRNLFNFPMSLDFWIGGLLIQDPSFKVKQHFVLK